MQLTATDKRWIRRAELEAHFSRHRVRVGAAVVVRKHGAVAHNKIRNNPAISWRNASTHAEVAALRRSPARGEGGTVYVVRLGATGALLPSYPCERCLPALSDAGVRKIIWYNGTSWVKQKMPEI